MNPRISLHKLSLLSKLTLLDVSQLRTRDAYGLAKAVGCLTELQNLRTVEALDDVDHDRDGRPTPLSLFLVKLYSESLSSGIDDVASDTLNDLSDSDDD